MSFTASDVMKSPVISVNAEATLVEAIKLLSEHNISGLPVVGSENKVVGIITEKDILECSKALKLIPLIGSSGWLSPPKDTVVVGATAIKEAFELQENTKVEKCMTKEVVTVEENYTVEKVAGLMEEKDVNRIPVVDSNGKLSGIIARKDLVNYLAKPPTSLS